MDIIRKYNNLDNNSRLYLVFISIFWLIDYFMAFARRIGIEPFLSCSILLLFFAIISHGKWRHLIRISDIVLYFILISFYFISIVIYPISKDVAMSKAIEVLCMVVPFYFVGVIFKAEEYKYWLTILSRISILINILFSVIVYANSSDVDEESMHRAYVMLPSVLFVLWQLLDRYSTVDLLFFALGFFMLCSMGSRGPFVCVLFFALVYLFFFKKWKHRTFIRVVLVAAAMFLYALSSYIAVFMISLLAAFGSSTRIFDKMLNDSLINYEQSSGRDRIHEDLLGLLNTDYKGFGFGLFSDRVLTGYNSHNFFIELIFSFGYLMGSVIFVIILVLFVRFLIKSKNNYTKVFGLLFFTASFFKLMFSGSFITDGLLFFMIGYCVNGLRAVRPKTVIKTP